MEFLCVLSAIFAYFIHQAFGFCERPTDLIHGSGRSVFNNKWIFECDQGYAIQGRSEVTCINGLLRGERPFCAKPGCKELENPKNGKLINPEGLKAEIKCNNDYVLVGNKFTYCDGNDWQIRLGTCQGTQNYSCDFEREDLCGWTFPHSKPQPWSRISTLFNFHSTKTGSQRDHTFQNNGEGHFIRMETQSGATGNYHFESPVFPQHLSLGNTTCFQFHFFMFGEGVGSLFVSVKPASMSVVEMWEKFQNHFTQFQKCGIWATNGMNTPFPLLKWMRISRSYSQSRTLSLVLVTLPSMMSGF
ncbi:uncharacterized protein LOC110179901 [Drosophila serrata]|uniref:uncharacterized protein LOC110179901 n=1 Tax=Drosophila serrata TaxID=7274 RepID=UPI000A1D050F|nr:uncharacterized protein LOC110179901 [Drosophila serrata]